MKRILCLLLCLCMAFASVAALSSCKKKDGEIEPEVSKKTVSVDLSEYSVVYAADMTSNAKNRVNSFVAALNAKTSLGMRASEDEETEPVSTDDAEILIGNTNRKETQKALKSVGDCGWAIRVFDNKIVIVGTNSFLTRAALSYFERNYVNDGAVKGATVTVNQKVSLEDLDTADFLNEAGEGQYVLVYDDRVDDIDNGGRNAYSYAGDANPTGGSETDYIFTLVTAIRDRLAKDTKAKKSTFMTKKASSDVENEYEILVGNMSRDDVKAELNKLDANEYGVVIRNNKIMILAWNDATLVHAYALFEDLLASCAVSDEGADTTVYAIPSDCALIERVATGAWMTDFPKPEAADLYLDGTVDVGDSSIEYIYAGAGANEENYNAYCQTLVDSGYTMIYENLHPDNTQNCFRQYTNEESGIALYVYYSPYEFAAEQKVTDILASIRIVATPMEGTLTTLPGTDILNASTYNSAGYTKVTETMITSVEHDYKISNDVYSWGLSYIITLEDGTFMVFDGGAGLGSNDNYANMWKLLNKLHSDAHGANAANKKIHVRAWMITHEHMDHFTVFKKVLENYGGRFTLDYLLFNATSESECINSDNPESVIRKNMAALQNKAGFKYIKVHTGQTFYFANCKMEILATHEDTYPKKLEYFNNSTSIFKTTLKSTDAQGGSRESDCIWLGDVERIGGRRLRAMWGSNLASEMVQVAHHGGNGTDSDVYRLINPKIVWFPNDSRYVDSVGWANSKTWCNRVTYVICHDIENVDMVIMSEKFDYTMRFTTAGPQYDAVFDVMTGEVKPFDNVTLIDKR